jgi:CDP-glucose 4,6-dehydratase
MVHMFSNIYAGKKVLVTGHTGFKGSWLTAWLLRLGADVIGYSRDIPTTPAMFSELNLVKKIQHHTGDVRDLDPLRSLIISERPNFVFHLAAQAIVSTSYADPVDTITTNVIGTMNVLEALRGVDFACVAILITSDKCYDNVEWVWGYRETDALGGKDIYSGSKGAAELVIKSYLNSFFQDGKNQVRIGIGRAGNVIGGGDWAPDRIVADIMRAWHEERTVEIRSPNATRPWQHVLEPLSGYLALGMHLYQSAVLHGEAFNFGPRAEQNRTVVDLITELSQRWGFADPSKAYQVTGNIPFYEASLLKLNCDKALFHLKWEPNLMYSQTISFISDWYSAFYREQANMLDITMQQIGHYERIAVKEKKVWTVQ